MQASLRNRLLFGPLMLAALWGILDFDRAIERWTRGWVTTPAGTFGLAGVGLFLLLMLLLPLATQELATLLTHEKVRPYRGIAATGSGLLTLHAFLSQFGWFQPIAASALAYVLVLVMVLAALRRAWGRQSQQAITHMAGTVFAMLYLGGLAWFLMALRVKHSINPHGFRGSTAAIFMILLVVKFADIGAFFIGSRFGKHKLIPWLSPKKSWEGFAAGIVTSAIVGLICTRIWPVELTRLDNIPKALIFGGIIGAVGQAGDLLESLMKRDAEVKDSGQFIPGFGGLLDIIDSPLLAAPVAYLLFSCF
jgi:phosphatidate cytidylyltransferase